MSLLRLVFAAQITLACCAFTPPALSLERQWHLGVDISGAALETPSGAHLGPGGGAHLAYGVTDWLNLELAASLSHHPKGDATVLGTSIAAYYTLDVIEWVPYAGLFAGGYQFFGDNSALAFGGGLALGLDYQFHRSFSLGVQARLHEVFAPDPFGATTYGTLGLRGEYLWGF